MQVPADVYAPSVRPYAGLSPVESPFHDWSAAVTHCGRVCYRGQKVNVSQALAGQLVGVRQVDDCIWVVTFMHYDLGYFDDETCPLEPIAGPFAPTVLPTVFGIRCYPCLRNEPSGGWRPHRDSNPGFSLERATS